MGAATAYRQELLGRFGPQQPFGVDRETRDLNHPHGRRDVLTRDAGGHPRAVPVLVDGGEVGELGLRVAAPGAEHLRSLADVVRRGQHPLAAGQRAQQSRRSGEHRVGPRDVREHEAEHRPLVGEVEDARVLPHQQLVADDPGDPRGLHGAADVLEQREAIGPGPLARIETRHLREAGCHDRGGQTGLEGKAHCPVAGKRHRPEELGPARPRDVHVSKDKDFRHAVAMTDSPRRGSSRPTSSRSRHTTPPPGLTTAIEEHKDHGGVVFEGRARRL